MTKHGSSVILLPSFQIKVIKMNRETQENLENAVERVVDHILPEIFRVARIMFESGRNSMDYQKAFDEGFECGKSNADSVQYDQGYEEGKFEGYEQGYKDGKSEGFRHF